MITITRTYQVNAGTAPYTFAWGSDDGCVVFTNPSGTSSNGAVPLYAVFATEQCFAGATLTLSVTDANSCTQSFEVTIDNPCDDFTLGVIQTTGDYEYVVTGSNPACADLNFEWYFSDPLFNLVGQTDSAFSSALRLSLKDTNLPSNSGIQVVATDCNGCQRTQVYSQGFCTPEAHDVSITLFCAGTQYRSTNYLLPAPVNCISPIDWSTLQLSLPTGITYTQTGQFVRLTAPLTNTPGIFSGTYSVENELGIRSTLGTITITIQACPVTDTIQIVDQTIFLPCDLEPDDVFEINVEDSVFVAQGTVVDWTSATVNTPPTPISSSITFGISTATGKWSILYTAPDPVGADVFSWTVCDTLGNCAQSAVYTVVDCPDLPTANDDESCVACGQTVTIDVLSNDVGNGGPLIPSSVTITQAPSFGTATVVNGEIVYTANTNFTGEDTLEYTVQNSFGETSEPAEVTIDVVCAGGTAQIIICGA